LIDVHVAPDEWTDAGDHPGVGALADQQTFAFPREPERPPRQQADQDRRDAVPVRGACRGPVWHFGICATGFALRQDVFIYLLAKVIANCSFGV
jgi:hypothetical protein